jgi:spore germination protein GerM
VRVKRYQIALIFFALGISIVTFSLDWFIGLRDDATPVSPDVGLEYSSVNIFFSNTEQDPNTLYCDKTYPTVREISRLTDNPESRLGELTYVVMKELLKGPTELEKSQGFFTSINVGSKVQKISIVEGVATVDFNQAFNEGVGGSCRVQAIRSQITETLKEFPEIKEVIISVDGEIEEILQP